MRLLSFSDKPYVVISQSLHGVFQNYMALDFAHLKGIAPAKGKIIYNRPQKDAKQGYFGFGLDNWSLQFTHARPLKSVGDLFAVAQGLWNTTWHHVHLSLKVDGKWYPVLSALDWDKVDVYWLKYGQKHPVWTNKSTYKLIELPPYSLNTNEMVTLQQKIKCKVISTIDLRIRKEPNTQATIIGELKPGAIFETYKVAAGTKVNTTNAWYEVNGGWVTGAYIEIVSNNKELEEELKKANIELAQLRPLKEQVKSVVDLIKSIITKVS